MNMRYPLAILREQKRLTQAQLAEMIGGTQAQISKWERGGGISAASLQKLSAALDCSVEELKQEPQAAQGHVPKRAVAHTNNPIAKRRVEMGISQGELAKLIGVTQAMISAWECGKHMPMFSHLNKLAALFNCSIVDLVED